MIIFEVVRHAIVRRLAPLPGFPVGSEQSFQVATDPGSDGALPIDGPGEHSAGIGILNEWSFIMGHRFR
jgi:hypothetical protein